MTTLFLLSLALVGVAMAAGNGATTRRTARRNKGGRPPVHGARQAERRLRRYMRHGVGDRRTLAVQTFEAIRTALVDDQGGPDRISVAKRLLIDEAAFELTLLMLIRRWAFRQETWVTADGEICNALGKYRIAHHNSARRTLEAVGLERVLNEPLSLDDYLRQRASDAQQPASRAESNAEREVDSEAAAGGNGRACEPQTAPGRDAGDGGGEDREAP